MTFRKLLLSLPSFFLLASLAADELPDKENTGNPPPKNNTSTSLNDLASERSRLDQTVYRDERTAQAHEGVFVTLWDRLRNEDPFEVLGQQEFETLTLPAPSLDEKKDWGIPGIEIKSSQTSGESLNQEGWQKWLDRFQKAGWILEQSEWHHDRFEPGTDTTSAKSLISATGHLLNARLNERIILKGRLEVTWADRPDDNQTTPRAAKITFSDFKSIRRTGDPVFSPMGRFDVDQASGGRWQTAQPLLLHDLNGDGLSEIVLAGASLILRNDGRGAFSPEPITGIPRPFDGAAILADFNGDGIVDLLGTPKRSQELQLLAGTRQGAFETPKTVFSAPFQAAQGMTAGDIDGDGDLDVYVFQYRQPYVGGQMPSPYYDANDGHPSYLLENDGHGNLKDITETAGLGPKRHRRTYSACLVDLNNDASLDLAVVSDFAGLDLYHNDGNGRFSDVTKTRVDQPHAFGMGQTIDDFNADGLLDLYMIGMSSTTARRIVALGIDHPEHPVESKLRPAMGYGNRMYLAGKDGFRQSPSADQVARTGWSWGVSSADFDNDGDRDLYVANGHVSGNSCHDYCTRFWSHDIYTNNSGGSPVIEQLFLKELQSMIQRETSWNGYEKNVLYLQDDNGGFLNVSYLLGVAFEFDSRAVATDDLNGDGLMDLLVVELDQKRRSEVVHLLRNKTPVSASWMGVRLQGSPQGATLPGTKVFAIGPKGRRAAVVVIGDSYKAQHAPVVHFGMGRRAIEELEIHWSNGAITREKNPATNRYLDFTAPPSPGK